MQIQYNCILANTEKHCMASFSSPSQHVTIDLFQMTHLYRSFPLTQLQERFWLVRAFCLQHDRALFRKVCYTTALRMWLSLDSNL